jgi:hypothetical protein
LNLNALWSWFAASNWRLKLLVFATLVVLIELALRRFARKSTFYRKWQAAFEAIGEVWTAVLLIIVYALAVGPIGLVMRLAGKDPLDRRFIQEPTLWRSHEPNPLGTEAAARHQF